MEIAVIGGGQLARMMQEAALALDIRVRYLAASQEDCIVAAAPDVRFGSPSDFQAVLDLARGADALTFEHEHVPREVIDAVVAAGIPVRPGPEAIALTQDKALMRRALTDLGVPCPQWTLASDADACVEFAARLGPGSRFVAKMARGGYDGHGVRFASGPEEIADWLASGPVLLEEAVPFARELAALVARGVDGDMRAWPVVETVQKEGMCAEVFAPAPGLSPAAAAQADSVARRIAEATDVVGVLAVELFELPERREDGALVLVNELAMRPHNSGHWTIEGAVTSQFAQHLMAVAGLPLGSGEPVAPAAAMFNIIGADGEPSLARALAAAPDASIHLYGKAARSGRKLGHATALAASHDLATAAARAAAQAAAG